MKRISTLFFIFLISVSFWQVKANITITVGANGADFATLKEAFTAIRNNTGGIYTGAITIKIIDNTTETGICQLTTSTVWTSILIYPTTPGLSITGNFGNNMILLDAGVKNVTIDGRVNATGTTRSLTLSNLGGADLESTTIRMNAGSSDNTIKYCTIKGSGYKRATIYVPSGASNLTISNNLITCADEVKRPQCSLYISELTSENNKIIDNEFVNVISGSLESSPISLYNNKSWEVSGNSFYETNPIVPTNNLKCDVIRINCVNGAGKISNNFIGGTAPNCAGNAVVKTNTKDNQFIAMNIVVGTSSATNIQNNVISKISWSNSDVAQWTGIYVNGKANVSGNTISKIIKGGSAANVTGIKIYNGANNVNANFITSITTPDVQISEPSNIYGIQVTGNSGAEVSTYSNNIISLGGDYSANLYGISELNGTATGKSNFYFNTISLYGTQPVNSVSKSQCFYVNSKTTTINIQNNIFSSSRSTIDGLNLHCALYGDINVEGILNCDYNDYYVTGTGSNLGFFNSEIKTNIPLIANKDVNSFITNPLIKNSFGEQIADYKIAAILIGAPDTGIETDISNSIRIIPTIGAWEEIISGINSHKKYEQAIFAIGGSIHVSDTKSGEVISVYTLSGQLLKSVIANCISTIVPLNRNGVYIVKTSSSIGKVIL
jgi:hypothetical protein